MRTKDVPTFASQRLQAAGRPIKIDTRPFPLEGALILPSVVPKGALVFANGAPRSHWDSPAGYLAAGLESAGFAVLMLDLLAVGRPAGGDDAVRDCAAGVEDRRGDGLDRR
jgi:hypothetical protein